MNALPEHVAIGKALADPVRLRVLKLLEGRELCVCQIHPVIGGPPSGLSRHLLILKSAGLIRARKDGRWIHYRLNFDDAPVAARQALGLVAGWLNDDPRIRKDRETLAALLKRVPGPACPPGGEDDVRVRRKTTVRS